MLDPRAFEQSARFDALNRVVEQQTPKDVKGRRHVVRPRYNRAGALEGVSLDGRVVVEHVAYDAKGQRTLELHGNGVLVRWAYDPDTFRLAQIEPGPTARRILRHLGLPDAPPAMAQVGHEARVVLPGEVGEVELELLRELQQQRRGERSAVRLDEVQVAR